MKTNALLWAAPLALFALVGAIVWTIYRAATPTAEELAREVIEVQVRDPQSLQLRNVRRIANGGICGEVNARNGFGGYTGFQRFYLVGTFVSVEGETDLTNAVAEQCDE